MKNAKKSIDVPYNPKRGMAKKERKKGQLYMASIGADEKEFSKINDPLYGVKGMERFLAMKNIR